MGRRVCSASQRLQRKNAAEGLSVRGSDTFPTLSVPLLPGRAELGRKAAKRAQCLRGRTRSGDAGRFLTQLARRRAPNVTRTGFLRHAMACGSPGHSPRHVQPQELEQKTQEVRDRENELRKKDGMICSQSAALQLVMQKSCRSGRWTLSETRRSCGRGPEHPRLLDGLCSPCWTSIALEMPETP